MITAGTQLDWPHSALRTGRANSLWPTDQRSIKISENNAKFINLNSSEQYRLVNIKATISLQSQGKLYEIPPTLKKTIEVPELLLEHAGAHGRDDGSQGDSPSERYRVVENRVCSVF